MKIEDLKTVYKNLSLFATSINSQVIDYLAINDSKKESSAAATMRFLVVFAAFIIPLILARGTDLLSTLALGLLSGVALYKLSELGHEAWHGALSTSRRVNDIIGIIISFVLFYPFSLIRATHLRHHRHQQGPLDPEMRFGRPLFARPLDYERVRAVHLFLKSNRAALFLFLLLLSPLSILYVSFSIGALSKEARNASDGLASLAKMACVLCLVFYFGVSLPFLIAIWLTGILTSFTALCHHNHQTIYMDENKSGDLSYYPMILNVQNYRVPFIDRLGNSLMNSHMEHHFFPTVPLSKIHKFSGFIDKAGLRPMASVTLDLGRSADRDVFMINLLDQIIGSISTYGYTRERVDELSGDRFSEVRS